MKKELIDLEDVERLAKKLAPLLKEGDVISLSGDLGAGKTTLVQYLTKELGVDDYVTSPTFALVNIYFGDFTINHMDLYRLEHPDELLQLDYESYFYPDGITFIEWAEMGQGYLPENIVEINIEKAGDSRVFELIENNDRSKEIGEGLSESFSDWYINYDVIHSNIRWRYNYWSFIYKFKRKSFWKTSIAYKKTFGWFKIRY